MHWLIPLNFYFFFAVFSFLLRRSLAKRFIHYNRLINAIFLVVFHLPAALTISRFFPNNLDVGWLNLLFLGIGSLIWPIANLVAFRANHKLDAGIFSIISNLAPIFTLLVALTFLGENLNYIQIIGSGLLILSGIIITLPLLGRKSTINHQEILIGILSAAIVGIAICYERFMLTRIDFGAYLVYGWGSQILWGALLAIKDYKYLPKLFASNKLRNTVLAYGLSSTLQGISFVIALSLVGASVIGPAANFVSVIIVIAGYLILGERDHLLNKLAAVTIGISGLLLISN